MLLLLGALVLAAFMGPRVRIEEPSEEPDFGADLEGRLAELEGRYDDIVPGTEKTIVWADPERPGVTRWSIVYLHGFSATRQEVVPLIDDVAAELGANVFYTRLRGHGRSSEAMGEAEVRDWLADAWEALEIGQRIGRRVLVVGTSTGGALATWLAARHGDEGLGALVLISPNFEPRDDRWRMLLRPWAPVLVPLVFGKQWGFETISDEHEKWWTSSYPTRALLPMAGLVELVAGIDGSEIRAPTLAFVAERDALVDPAATERRIAGFAAPVRRVVVIEDADDPQQHVLAGRVLSPTSTPTVRERLLAFVRELDAAPPGSGRRGP